MDEQKKFFKDNHKSFKYYGRDMETLLFHTKMAHSNRIFFESDDVKTKINMLDIKMGYKRLVIHNNIDKGNDKLPANISHMYV